MGGMAALPPLGAAAATKPVRWPCHVSITIDGSWGGRPVDSYRGVAVLSGATGGAPLGHCLSTKWGRQRVCWLPR